MGVSLKGLTKCLVFFEEDEDYEKKWSILLDVEGRERKYPGLEMRAAV